MPINASIPLGVQPLQFQQRNPNEGMNALARTLQIKSMADEQNLRAQEVAERNVLNEAYRGALGQDGAVDRNMLMSTLANRGLGARIPGIQKQFADADKATADVGKVRAETEAKQYEVATKRVDSWGQAMGFVRQNPTAENAAAAMQHLVSMGVMPPEKAQAALAQIQANPTPQAIAQFAEMGMRAALSNIQTRNTGGTTDTIAVDPVTHQTRVVNSVQNTQSPDNVASNARMAADAAAGRAVTIRGQDLTDQRQREANAITARKASPAIEKELVGIRQQNAIVDGALEAVDKTPSAFSMGRGMATMAGPIPESVAGRFDNDAERQARSYVFNNVSKVINERAGAAQSAQELARLRSFLPAETDNADQIKSKLKAFKTYLSDMEAGTRGGSPAQSGGASGGWSIQKVN
jgi:hypothetical protein